MCSAEGSRLEHELAQPLRMVHRRSMQRGVRWGRGQRCCTPPCTLQHGQYYTEHHRQSVDMLRRRAVRCCMVQQGMECYMGHPHTQLVEGEGGQTLKWEEGQKQAERGPLH